MDSLVNHLKKWLDENGLNKKYLLAYSGGLDSHVLLHLLATFPIQLRAITINHGVNANAFLWSKHCAQICTELNVEFIERQIKPLNTSLNLEEQLREQRYQLLANELSADEVLLTAHHQNDQAETMLLQLCRGAGLSGLAAMPRMKSLGQGFHARPLLDFTRDDLLQYAKHHQLQWIEDESNFNPHFTRNFLRHDIIPLLTKRWPTVSEMFARAAAHCADADAFISITTNTLLKTVAGTVAGSLSVKKLLLLDETEQRHVLRAFIEQKKMLLPSTAKMQQIMQTILHARSDKMPHVHWGNVELRRYRDNIFLMPKLEQHDTNQIIPWDFSESLVLPNMGKLQAQKIRGQGLRADLKNVTVRFRQGGEVLQLPGRHHHHTLKKMFQTWGVLPWLRDRIPLVYADGVLAAVVGFWLAEELTARDDAYGYQIFTDRIFKDELQWIPENH